MLYVELILARLSETPLSKERMRELFFIGYVFGVGDEKFFYC